MYSEQSQRESLVPTLLKNGKAEMSVFQGKPATHQQIATSMAKLLVAFPNQSDAFFNLLAERIAKKGISAERLEYAIDHTLDTFTYKTLTIADIMSIDRRVEVMTYSEMVNEAHKQGVTTDEFAPLYIGDNTKPFWVSKADKARFNIPSRI